MNELPDEFVGESVMNELPNELPDEFVGESGTIVDMAGWANRFDVIMTQMGDELGRAMLKFPRWQIDPVHAAGVVVEEAGELMQAALDSSYSACNHKDGIPKDRMRKEALQVAAMAIRFLINIDRYKPEERYEERMPNVDRD